MTSPLDYALSQVANDQGNVIPIAAQPIDKILDGIAGPAIIRLPPFQPGEFKATRLIYGQTLTCDFHHYAHVEPKNVIAAFVIISFIAICFLIAGII